MSKHKLRTYIDIADDLEVKVEIAFDYWRGSPAIYYGDTPHPEEPASVEFIDASPLDFRDQAEAWFTSDAGQTAAFEQVADDDEAAREYAADMRADR